MSANPMDALRADVLDFERANAGNSLILICKQFGSALTDDWIVRYPPPWTEDMLRAFTESAKLGIAVGFEDHFSTRRERRIFKKHLENLQCVALLSAHDRMIEHSLSGFVGGTA